MQDQDIDDQIMGNRQDLSHQKSAEMHIQDIDTLFGNVKKNQNLGKNLNLNLNQNKKITNVVVNPNLNVNLNLNLNPNPTEVKKQQEQVSKGFADNFNQSIYKLQQKPDYNKLQFDNQRQSVDWTGPANISGEKDSYCQGFMSSTSNQFQQHLDEVKNIEQS